MVSRQDIRSFLSKHSEDLWCKLDDNDNVINKENGWLVCSLDEFLDMYRREAHCDFEVIYYCPVSLQVFYRCRECGTVIFSTDGEDYDHALCCPCCGNYETSFQYWTAKDIDADPEKQKYITSLIRLQEEQNIKALHYKARGLHDWQVWKGSIKLFNKGIFMELDCDDFYKSWLEGLNLKIWLSNRNGCVYELKKSFCIPLSAGALKRKCKIFKKKQKNS